MLIVNGQWVHTNVNVKLDSKSRDRIVKISTSVLLIVAHVRQPPTPSASTEMVVMHVCARMDTSGLRKDVNSRNVPRAVISHAEPTLVVSTSQMELTLASVTKDTEKMETNASILMNVYHLTFVHLMKTLNV